MLHIESRVRVITKLPNSEQSYKGREDKRSRRKRYYFLSE